MLADPPKQALFPLPFKQVCCNPLRTPRTGTTLRAGFGHAAGDENVKGAHGTSLRQM